MAARAHGVLSLAELRELGLTDDQVKHRVRLGRLHRLFRGVYAVGHRHVSPLGEWRAATLAVSDSSLSHGPAPVLWRLRDRWAGPIHLTAPRQAAPRPGLVVHRRRLPSGERTIREGIPVTTLARTLLDVAATEGHPSLERCLREAHFRYRPADPAADLAGLVRRHPGARGTAIAREVLAERAFTARTRSELEARFLDLLAGSGIERPQTNVVVDVSGRRLEVDCLWRGRRLVVELDGAASHLAEEGFEADRSRDAALLAAGYRVLRITWRRLHAEPDRLVAELRTLLAPAS